MGVSRRTQIAIYVGKNFRLFKNERGWKVFLFAGVISLLVSSVLGNGVFSNDLDTWSAMFALISACIWIGIFNSIQSICKERDIIKREHRTGLHISAYVAAHLIFQAAICLAESLELLVISAVFLRYPGSAMLGSSYIEYCVSYFLILYGADALGLAVSALVKSPAVAMTVMPFVLIVQLVFSGALFTLDGPLANISRLTLSRWGLNAACICADYNSLENTQQGKLTDALYYAALDRGFYISRDEVRQVVEDNFQQDYRPEYAHTVGNLLSQWGVLLLHCAAYAAVSIIALEFIDKDKR